MPLLSSLRETAQWDLFFFHRHHHLEGSRLSTVRKSLDFPRLLSDLLCSCSPRLGRRRQPCQRQMGELESSCLSAMCSGHIYKTLRTFLASSTISQTPKAARCTPHASKESCVHTCQPGQDSFVFLSCLLSLLVSMRLWSTCHPTSCRSF